MINFDQFGRPLTPYSVASSGVSTPSMTPPLIGMYDHMMSHQPLFIGHGHAAPQAMNISHQIQQLQAQTSQLIALVKQGQSSVYYPQNVMGHHYMAAPTPPLVNGSNDAYQAALNVFQTVPPQYHMEESVLAKAVVAAANALVSIKTGSLRSGTPLLVQPEAVRARTPAWLQEASRRPPESPAPSEGQKANSPLAEVMLSLAHADGPVFGLKSPGTVMKCKPSEEEE